MVERLFFDGIDLEGSGGGVTEAEEFAVLIDADETEAGLAGADVAVARTEKAVDAVVGFGSPPEGFVEGGGFLEDGNVGHGAGSLVKYTPGGRKRFTTEDTESTEEEGEEVES